MLKKILKLLAGAALELLPKLITTVIESITKKTSPDELPKQE